MGVGWVGVEVEAGEVRYAYPYAALRLRDAVQFLHDLNDTIKMLQHMLADNRAEGRVVEWVREGVEVPHHIGMRARVDVEGNRAYNFALTRAYVQEE